MDKGIRVLVVETRLSPQQPLELLFAEASGADRYDLQTVGSVDEAIGRLEADGADLVLLDVADVGPDVLVPLNRLLAAGPDAPVVIVAEVENESAADDALVAGASDYLVRGQLDAHLLVRAVRYALERAKAEQALRDNEERFRTIFEQASVGLYRMSPDGRLAVANPAMLQMLGYDSAEQLRESPPDERHFPRSVFRQLMDKQGYVTGLETTIMRPDGSERHIRESARAVKDRDGNVMHYEGSVLDITERKRAEEALRESENCSTGPRWATTRLTRTGGSSA
jgi:PAS domain S-box-containing protein